MNLSGPRFRTTVRTRSLISGSTAPTNSCLPSDCLHFEWKDGVFPLAPALRVEQKCRSFDPHCDRRVGEASHPGPYPYLGQISADILDLSMQVDRIAHALQRFYDNHSTSPSRQTRMRKLAQRKDDLIRDLHQMMALKADIQRMQAMQIEMYEVDAFSDMDTYFALDCCVWHPHFHFS